MAFFPAADSAIHVHAIEHGTVLDGLIPAKGIGFTLLALLRRGQIHRSIQPREIDHHTVFIDESPPDLVVSLFRSGTRINGGSKL